MDRNRNKVPLCVTMGEPAGIGGEILLRAWQERRQSDRTFFAIDDPERLSRIAGDLGWPVPVRAVTSPEEATKTFWRALPVLPVGRKVWADPGRPREDNAGAVIESIERAVTLTRTGKAAAVVTNPIHKAVLTRAGFPYPGHTEFLGALAGVKLPVMMLVADRLRAVPLTIHIAIAEVPKLINRSLIVDSAKVVAKALGEDFGIAVPRLAVAGLNPHAGEDGTMGDEEIRIIRPAVEELRRAGLSVEGPYPADTLFSAGSRESFDVALCMYHDQALIPIKTLAMEEAVNVTLGLPFIRTSPDHGTAFNIAGTGRASPASLLAAIDFAARLATEHAEHRT